ncbi:26S proteasome complex subunit SEM1 [Coemansia sp. RSA 1933]|nr:26S proteasome complex subunit SEM1 [Coemansia sp. RSA 1933]
MSTSQNASKDTRPEQSASSTDPTAKQQTPVANMLEEDDEFEEFEIEDWNEDAEDKEDVTLWDDNWDDDDLEDDFSKQLRVELEKTSQPEAMAVSN